VQPLLTVWLDQDVGSVGPAGNASYSNGAFTVNASGQFIWSTADGFNFLYQPLSGDGSIVARVVSVQGGASVEAGVMIRETLDAGSEMAFMGYSGSTDMYFIYRPTAGGNNGFANTGAVTLPYWMKVTRSGSTLSGFVSSDGANWVQVGGSQTISMAQNVYAGLAVSSNNNSALATATFDNVSVSSAAAPAPAISSVSPSSGPVGTQVTITGTGFGSSQGSSAVYLNEVATTVNSWSAASISITVPAGATSGPLSVAVAPTMNSSNAVVFTVGAQQGLPAPWLDQDIGAVGPAGSASFANGVFTVNASGQFIWSTADGFNFAYQPLSGDGSIVARVVSVQGGGSVEAGVMIRETLTAASDMAFMGYSGSTDMYFIYRPTAGANNGFANTGSVTLPYWVKATRSGSTLSGFVSSDGVNWVQVGGSQTISMAQKVYVGLAVSSNNNSALATATFDNVSVGP
jgi:hypothetical protein